MNAMHLVATAALFLPSSSFAAATLVGAPPRQLAPVAAEDLDLVPNSFAAVLLDSDGDQRADALLVALVTRTSGYTLALDASQRSGDDTNVFLRLERPNPSEAVMPILTPHALLVKLGPDLGARILIQMARTTRGEVVIPVYELVMTLSAKLPPPPPPQPVK